jgi:pimeloyl-ACP methyl ester carboxylesterase
MLATADAHLEYLCTGEGAPVTVFAHGLAGSIAETRPLGSGVAGTRVFLHLRGHGASTARQGGWSYGALAGELHAVAGHTGATQALGVSLGAGALTALVAQNPDRFERLVLFLPAALDRPREGAGVARLRAMGRLVDDQDVDGLAGLLLAEQPGQAHGRRDVQAWVHRQAEVLVGSPVAWELGTMHEKHPVADVSALAAVSAPVLVLAQEGDEAHSVEVAEEIATAFPGGRLHVFGAGGALWAHRRELREVVTDFLNLPRQ